MPAVPHPIYLSDVQPVETSGTDAAPNPGLVNINGTSYVHGLNFVNAFCRETTYADYDLSRHFSTFSSKVGLPNNGRSDSPIVLGVYIDLVKVYEHQFQLGEVQDLNLPITGKLRIRFEVTRVNRSWCTGIALGDPLITP